MSIALFLLVEIVPLVVLYSVAIPSVMDAIFFILLTMGQSYMNLGPWTNLTWTMEHPPVWHQSSSTSSTVETTTASFFILNINLYSKPSRPFICHICRNFRHLWSQSVTYVGAKSYLLHPHLLQGYHSWTEKIRDERGICKF